MVLRDFKRLLYFVLLNNFQQLNCCFAEEIVCWIPYLIVLEARLWLFVDITFDGELWDNFCEAESEDAIR